jgi:hypothetical protein
MASPAHAATWNLNKAVTKVTVTENTSNGTAGQQLEITVASAGTHCGVSKTNIVILKSETTDLLFDAWVRTAEAALLSGRNLTIGSSNVTGTCYTWYLSLN